jgi:hypothetical protein
MLFEDFTAITRATLLSKRRSFTPFRTVEKLRLLQIRASPR